MSSSPQTFACLCFAFLSTGVCAQQVLLDATFDGLDNGSLEDFSFQGNDIGVAAGGSWNPATGLLSMVQDAASAGTMGIVSVLPGGGVALFYDIDLDSVDVADGTLGRFFVRIEVTVAED